jgi:chromosome segregation ATPase
MLSTNNLEKLIELETNLRNQYQTQLDAKSAEINAGIKKQEEQKAVIARQLEQITTLSREASANKHVEQQLRELESRTANLQEEVATQKKRLKKLQNDLAEERAEIKILRQFDPARMKKNLDASKKKLAEKAAATDLLQKSVNRYKSENSELQRKVKELESIQEQLEKVEEAELAAA